MDSFDRMVCAGDVLCMSSIRGRWFASGAAGGWFGHLVLAVGPPTRILRASAVEELQEMWPDTTIGEVTVPLHDTFCLKFLESTSEAVAGSGLISGDLLLYVDPSTCKLTVFAENSSVTCGIQECERTEVDLWQSPPWLRSLADPVLASAASAATRASGGAWSSLTAVLAFLTTATASTELSATTSSAEIRAYWKERPICSTVPVVWWQQLFDIAASQNPAKLAPLIPTVPTMPADDRLKALSLTFMPVKASRVLPSSLRTVLVSKGWAVCPIVPRVAPLRDPPCSAPRASIDAESSSESSASPSPKRRRRATTGTKRGLLKDGVEEIMAPVAAAVAAAAVDGLNAVKVAGMIRCAWSAIVAEIEVKLRLKPASLAIAKVAFIAAFGPRGFLADFLFRDMALGIVTFLHEGVSHKSQAKSLANIKGDGVALADAVRKMAHTLRTSAQCGKPSSGLVAAAFFYETWTRDNVWLVVQPDASLMACANSFRKLRQRVSALEDKAGVEQKSDVNMTCSL
jgi:hypothetical protein